MAKSIAFPIYCFVFNRGVCGNFLHHNFISHLILDFASIADTSAECRDSMGLIPLVRQIGLFEAITNLVPHNIYYSNF